MTESEMRNKFKRHVKHLNFLTPWHIEYRSKGDLVAEFTRGTSMTRTPQVGCTVVSSHGHETELGQVFICDTFEEAKQQAVDYFRSSECVL